MIEIRQGDWIDVLRTMPDESVQCCVTSPPYWGLRNYGVPGQLGLERTPEEYVAKIVAGFREVRRVLRKDGTLWLNLGDSYTASNRGSGGHSEKQDSNRGSWTPANARGFTADGCKPKDLVGIPWMVAFALRADGWYLRQDIVWAKPNPMPESVRDRCTKSHEYLFLLSKSAKYYFDNDAIREPLSDATIERDKSPRGRSQNGGGSGESLAGYDYDRRDDLGNMQSNPDGRNRRSVWTVTTQGYSEAHFATFPPKLVEPCILAGCPEGGIVLDPFAGAGTTGKVCKELDRNAILIELNPAYIEMIERRIAATKDPCREKQETLPLISKEIK